MARFRPGLASLAAVVVLSCAGQTRSGDRHQEERRRMVENQIAARGVRDKEVLRVMGEVPRHLFVPDALRSSAYNDSPLPIGGGQTISQPYIVAVMTELLNVNRDHTVLEIGTGSGYQAAVLSLLAGRVYTIERLPGLAREASKRLRTLGYTNVTVRPGDGYKGWPEEAPFDRIIVTAAPPSIPRTLIDQLKAGGRMVAPVGQLMDQELVLIRKERDGRVLQEAVLPVRFVPMLPGGN